TSRRAVELAHEFDGLYATIGLHPIHTGVSYHDSQELGGGEAAVGFSGRGEVLNYDYYKELALDAKVVGIGECGLDYYHETWSVKHGAPEEEAKRRQKRVFEEQIRLASEVQKPLMIHSRDALEDTLDILNSQFKIHNSPGGIAHSFVREMEEAKKLLDLGFYFTFAGNITFKPKVGLTPADEVVKYIPVDRLLSETDAPYLAPVPHRGKRNEPLYVIEVVKKLAEIKGMAAQEMKEQIWQNARRVFKITDN
ncbi:MAG: TatD family hydrolase, partial [Candidatus Liptonbacteria bacterium]